MFSQGAWNGVGLCLLVDMRSYLCPAVAQGDRKQTGRGAPEEHQASEWTTLFLGFTAEQTELHAWRTSRCATMYLVIVLPR